MPSAQTRSRLFLSLANGILSGRLAEPNFYNWAELQPVIANQLEQGLGEDFAKALLNLQFHVGLYGKIALMLNSAMQRNLKRYQIGWFVQFLSIVQRNPYPELMDKAVTPDMIAEAVSQQLNRGWINGFAEVLIIIKNRPALLEVIKPGDIEKALNEESRIYSRASEIINQIKDQPHLMKGVKPHHIKNIIPQILTSPSLKDFVYLIEAIQNRRDLMAVLTPQDIEAVLTRQLANKNPSAFIRTVKAVQNFPHLRRVIPKAFRRAVIRQVENNQVEELADTLFVIKENRTLATSARKAIKAAKHINPEAAPLQETAFARYRLRDKTEKAFFPPDRHDRYTKPGPSRSL